METWEKCEQLWTGTEVSVLCYQQKAIAWFGVGGPMFTLPTMQIAYLVFLLSITQTAAGGSGTATQGPGPTIYDFPSSAGLILSSLIFLFCLILGCTFPAQFLCWIG
jgi:hypothetical protein